MTHLRPCRFLLVATLALAGAGCAGGSGGVGESNAPPQSLIYAGPEVAIESDGPNYLVVVSAPSGGWSLIWDEREEGAVYLTLRRPDPAFFHTLQVVEHRVGSGVPVGGPLEVHVRVLDHGEAVGDQAYALAASAG